MNTTAENVCSRENEEKAGSLSVIFRTGFSMGKLQIKEQKGYKRTAWIKRKNDRKEERRCIRPSAEQAACTMKFLSLIQPGS